MKPYRKTFFLLIVLTVCAFTLLAFAHMSPAKEIQVTFAWDSNVVPSFEDGTWEVLHLYQRVENGLYNYKDSNGHMNPNAIIPQEYIQVDDNWESRPTTYIYTTEVPDGQKTHLYWVIRAAATCTDVNDPKTCAIDSSDSEEVGLEIDLTPLPIPIYTATYNEVNKSIDFSWPIDVDSRIQYWKIFHRLKGITEWTELAQVDTSGSTSIPIGDLFPDREKTTREFTMVAYGKYDLFSQDGAITSITINRTPPSGVINFRINLVD